MNRPLLAASAFAAIAVAAAIYTNPKADAPQAAPISVPTISDIKAQAKNIPYEQLARTPDKFKGSFVVFEGKVVQALESGDRVVLRVNTAADDWQDNFAGNVVYVDYRKDRPDEPRILEDDKVVFWGAYNGIQSYKAVLGQTISIPWVVARLVEDEGRYVAPPFEVRRTRTR